MTLAPSPVGSTGTSRQAEQLLALDPDEPLHVRDRKGPRLLLHRQEAHRHRVAARRRQHQAALLGPVAQQRVRGLHQAAGAVADQRIGADRAAMVEIDQDLQPAADDVVRFSALDVDDKADAARVMLVAWIVKSGEPGFSRLCHGRCFQKPRSSADLAQVPASVAQHVRTVCLT